MGHSQDSLTILLKEYQGMKEIFAFLTFILKNQSEVR